MSVEFVSTMSLEYCVSYVSERFNRYRPSTSFKQILRSLQKSLEVAICSFRPPSYFANHNDSILVVHRINDTILALPNSIERIIQFHAPDWSRIIAKRAHGRDHALSVFLRYSSQLLFYISVDPQVIGHLYWPSRSNTSSAFSAAAGSSR